MKAGSVLILASRKKRLVEVLVNQILFRRFLVVALLYDSSSAHKYFTGARTEGLHPALSEFIVQPSCCGSFYQSDKCLNMQSTCFHKKTLINKNAGI